MPDGPAARRLASKYYVAPTHTAAGYAITKEQKSTNRYRVMK